ncbi:MAG: mechanosensitive ion channel family protein [Acidiferrobacterales bacterium]
MIPASSCTTALTASARGRVGAAWVVALSLVLPALTPAAGAEGFPLEPPDTSSPRATLKTFIENVNKVYRIYQDEGVTEANRAQFATLSARALGTLDLSELPPTQLKTGSREVAALIKEVLDRIELPPYEAIPDAAAMQALQESGAPPRWRVPHTEITIARVGQGPRQGEYLFTAKTVAQAKQFYERVSHLPYNAGASPGLYGIIVHGPGWMISESWIVALPAWMKRALLQLAVWQWIALASVLALGAGLLWLLSRWTRQRKRATTGAWHWGNLVLSFGVVAVAAGLIYFTEDQIGISGTVQVILNNALWVVFFVATGAGVFAIGNGIAAAIIASPRIKPESIDAHVIRITTRIVSLLVVFYLGVVAAQSLGVPLAPLLAGLGVGGLAVALAARPTLENLIGGVTLFADKPVRVGDFCRFGDKIGTVEEIGLRSTRIRTLDRTVVSVPNSQFSELQLENFAPRDRCRFSAVLQLRYETTPAQLRYVLARIRELLAAHPKVYKGPPQRARLVGFGDYSLNVEISTYADTTDWSEFLGIREDLFLRIMDIVKDAGTGFAIPTQTTYFTRAAQPDAARVDAVETQLQAWRAEGALPFPDLTEERRQQLTDTLDFPPAGSPEGPPAPARDESALRASNNPGASKK